MGYLGPVLETSYLSAQNAPQYRQIMRIFYLEYEKMHFQLYKEDVLSLLQSKEGYEAYTMDQLKQDLESLVGWKNLTPLQDPRRVYTIAEYKNKQYRYTMSEYAVEIERMSMRLDNLFLESGNLSTSLFVRMAESLQEADMVNLKGSKEINEWWNNLQDDFKRLNRNYQDYLREFYSGRADKLLKSMEFIVHKDHFISYLEEFIQELQLHAGRISAILRKNAQVIETQLLGKIVKSEQEIPHARSRRQENLEQYIEDNVRGKWMSLKNWFLPHSGQPSESSRVMAITNDVIRSIIQNASLIVQMQNWGISRKDDYRKFMELFAACPVQEQAHRLCAHVFGVQNIAHFKENSLRETDSISISVYEEEAVEFCLKPHTRSYRPRKDKQGFRDKTMEKLAQRTQYLQKIEREKNLVLRYIRDGKLELGAIDEIVEEPVRVILLQWIAQANLDGTKRGRTQFGQEFVLRQGEGDCVLKCADGDLILPAYVLDFNDTGAEL